MKKVDLKTAIQLLKNGDVVAIPTETVYGLGGWIHSEMGLNKIFTVKERPFFDPLIVHVDSIEKAKKLSWDWTPVHQALAEKCWPGPLTLITSKASSVNPLITSGLDSVGVRCPDHPLTLELLSLIEGGVAAPSANKFGKTSPTTSAHVFQEFGEQVAILEGGPSQIGIESTVAGVKKNSMSYQVEIYRPGFYTATMLETILKEAGLSAEVKYAASPVAPGQLKHHYMPQSPLVIVSSNFNWEKDRHSITQKLGKEFVKPVFWHQPNDPRMASRELYQKMREFDAQGADLIITTKLTSHEAEEWKGIWNRLEKAQSLILKD